jgi:hypothetical protein
VAERDITAWFPGRAGLGDKSSKFFWGTPDWVAPEIMVPIPAAMYGAMTDPEKQDLYGYADRYSLGLTCAFLVMGPQEFKKMKENAGRGALALEVTHMDVAAVIKALLDKTPASRCCS